MISGLILGVLVAQATPTQTPIVHCADPNREASVTNPMKPVVPKDVTLAQVQTALVEVTVGPGGNLVSSSIYKSTGVVQLDRSALTAARQRTYAT